MVAIVPKETAYVIQGGTGGNVGAQTQTQKGYIVLTQGGEAPVASSHTYGITTTGGSAPASGITKASTQVVLVNPAAITDSTTYVLAANAVRESSVMEALGYAVIYSFYPPYEDLVTELPFVNRQFPECVSYGSSGGPGFKTGIFEVDSGLTQTEIQWERIRARYNANFDHVPPEDIARVEDFFYGMKGKAIAFRYKDWSDYTISNQNFMVGDGVTTSFQIFKRYTSGGFTYDRMIKAPRSGSYAVALNGAQLILDQDYWVNELAGTIVFRNAPPPDALGTIIQGEFDVPVRFDTDTLDVSFDEFRQLNVSSLPMIEVLL